MCKTSIAEKINLGGLCKHYHLDDLIDFTSSYQDITIYRGNIMA